METHTKQPTKVLTETTQDVYDKFYYNLGSCFQKIPVTMNATQNASFLIDAYNKWNARHGTTSKLLLSFPQHLGFEKAGMLRYELTLNLKKPQLKTQKLCE